MKPINLENQRARREAMRRTQTSPAARAATLQTLQAYLRDLLETIDGLPLAGLARAAEEVMRARAEHKTVYILGNGGSAATASHAAADWLKPNHGDSRGGVNTVSLVDNAALLTAWANDTSFDNVFAAQLDSLLTAGDVVIAVSGSGNSSNVLRAVQTARRRGAVTVGLCGYDGGALASMVDVSVVVPCENQRIIEDIHMVMVHAISVALRSSAAEPSAEDATGEAISRRAATPVSEAREGRA